MLQVLLSAYTMKDLSEYKYVLPFGNSVNNPAFLYIDAFLVCRQILSDLTSLDDNKPALHIITLRYM